MKNYLYKFEFRSGEYESVFYRQTRAKNEREAIIEIVSCFMCVENEIADSYIANKLSKDEKINVNWTTEQFWYKMDRNFFSENCFEGYYLLDVREIKFDLDTIN